MGVAPEVVVNAIVEQPFLFSESAWVQVWDGNRTASAIYDRHYSRNPGSRGDPRVAGPGEKIALLTPCVRGLFVWRKFCDKCIDERTGAPQAGVNCAIFRNEGAGLSSDLIRAAMALAWARWPAQRLYTYVNPRRVRSTNPGFCFIAAGWRRCGVTKTRRLLVLEALPEVAS